MINKIPLLAQLVTDICYKITNDDMGIKTYELRLVHTKQ